MFPCSGCGGCCKKIDKGVEAAKTVFPDFPFPYSWDNSGKCEMLVDNKCLVYDTRPLICNIDEMAKFFDMSNAEYYKTTAASCNIIMDVFGIDESFRLPAI